MQFWFTGVSKNSIWNFQIIIKKKWNFQGLIKKEKGFQELIKKKHVEFPGVLVLGFEICKKFCKI